MAKGMDVRLDLGKVRVALDEGCVDGLTAAVEHLLTEANKDVPHDEGTLERSGEASVDDAGLRGAVSYNTPYAVRQHEDMTLRHDGKGTAKWLETAMAQEAKTMGKIVQQALARRLGG